MTRIAFYAPMKAPTHPTPSGDRAMARAILHALEDNPAGWTVDTVSGLRLHDVIGDHARQARLMAAADAETARILADARNWRVWITYHNYYKAPDLIGPRVAGALNIPYLLVEATRARKRLHGPWASFAAAAEAACDRAAVIFYMTDRDREALEANRPAAQRLVHLAPFLDIVALAPGRQHNQIGCDQPGHRPVKGAQTRHKSSEKDPHARLLAVGMMRPGDKLASYRALAQSLSQLRHPDWRLTIAGDGTARTDVEALFVPFAGRVDFLGQIGAPALADAYAQADVFVWPGVNEAFGMVYLEAQAVGLAILAEDRPGVREIVQAGGVLVPPENPAAFAAALDRLLSDPDTRGRIGQRGRAEVQKAHLRPAAAQTLWDQIAWTAGLAG